MKTIRIHLKTCCYGLILLIILQSCTVYYKAPVSLEQAAQTPTKTKIVLNDGRTESFTYISREGQQYFGSRVIEKDVLNIPIDAENVSEVKIKNNKGSRGLTAGIIAVGLGVLIAIGASNFSVDSGLDGI